MDDTIGSREIPLQSEMAPAAVKGLADFIKTHFVDPRLDVLSDGSFRQTWSGDGKTVELDWSFTLPQLVPSPAPRAKTDAHLSVGPRSVSVSFTGGGPVYEDERRVRERVADDIELLVNSFISKAKVTSLYFVFSTGGAGAGEVHAPARSTGGEVLRRVTSGNMMNLYLLIMGASFVLFFILGDLAIFAVLGIQLVALFFSDRLALVAGKVRPTADRPDVSLVCVSVSPETRESIQRYAKNLVSEVSDRLEDGFRRGAPDGVEAKRGIVQVLAGAGLKVSEGDVSVVTRNVYALVKGVADRFRLPVPKITIMNAVVDNASATGVSPGRAAVAITAGSLEDLDDAELSSVLGHEMGHVKGRDSLILFSVTFMLYVGGLYLWYPLLLFLGLLYYVLIFAVIFAVGKVLETRADTESVAKLGQPGLLASALTKIGFRQLYYEKYSPGIRFYDWLRFDPHPPIYFRVQRLPRLTAGGKMLGNTLLVSIRDCLTGFFGSLV